MVIDIPKPNPKQDLFLRDTHKYVIFGGARGGGKSWSIRTKAKILGFKYPGIRMCIVRRTYVELMENHIRPLREELNGICKYNDSRKEMKFPNGSILLFKYLSNEKDCDNFQGLEFDILFIDEATQIGELELKKIVACVRGVNSFPKRVYFTANPGGKSHGYFRRLIQRNFQSGENPDDYIFIQSLVTDNKILLETNEEYVHQLENLPKSLKEAWLFGNWNSFSGAYFEEFREAPDMLQCEEHGLTIDEALEEHKWTHVIEPFEIPSTWKIYRSYDWGYGKPFSMCWWAMDYDGILYQILEWYGCTETANEGVRLTNAEQFKHVQEIENSHRWLKGKKIEGVADPSIWDGSHDTDGISAAETAEKYGIFFEPGNNSRVAGWMQLRERLKFDENGKAMIYFFNTCKHSIRTIPLMMYDERNVEDLDTSLEDHACDSIRYQCMQHIIPPRLSGNKQIPMSDPLNQFEKYRNPNKMIRR